MISFDVGVLYAAVNGASPHFRKARALLERHLASNEVVLSEQVLVPLYTAIARANRAEAAHVIRLLRQNPNWRIVDAQSSRVEMNPVWQAVYAGEAEPRDIRKWRLAITLRQNGVTTFYTDEPDFYQDRGITGAVNPFV